MRRRVSTSLAVGAILAVAIAAAGCGGGGSKSNGTTTSGTTTSGTTTSSTTSTKPSGVNYTPSQKIIDELGYKECSVQQIPSTLFVNPNSSSGAGDFAGGNIYEIAKDCSTGPKITVYAATFSSQQGIAFGKTTLKQKYPKAGVSSFRTVVIGVVGGTDPQAMADKIISLLSAGTVTK